MEFEKLKEIVVEVLNVQESDVTMETAFVDNLGADSLDMFQIITEVEDTFGIEIPEDELTSITTIEDAVNKIKSATA